VPLAGIYHTDFPEYIARLFGRAWLGRFCAWDMGRFYRPFARVITRSRAYMPMVERLGVAPDRLAALRPGIDTARFDPRQRDLGIWQAVGAPELARPGVHVITIGRISVEKGMPLLVEAWMRAREELARLSIPARLVVVGDGPYRVEMERRLGAAGGGRGGDAFFLGFRHGAELARLHATGDLFVFPSATDTLGQVVMEAQSSGVPVLVSDRGGPREIVEDGRTGLVLPAEDVGAWARAIVDLAGDPERRRAMGRAASERLKPMTIGASFEHYWRLHEEVVAECPARNRRTGLETGATKSVRA